MGATRLARFPPKDYRLIKGSMRAGCRSAILIITSSGTMPEIRYQTPHGIEVSRITSKLPYRKGFSRFLRELDEYRGIYLSSGYEYPGRYSRWAIVSVRPP